jgi:hypothetical protein
MQGLNNFVISGVKMDHKEIQDIPGETNRRLGKP